MKRLQTKISFWLAGLILLVVGVIALSLDEFTPAPLFVGATLGLIAALLLAHFITRLWIEPLERIPVVLRELSEGDPGTRLHLHTGDERESAALSFNRMVAQLARQLEGSRREAHRLEAVLASMAEGVLVLDVSGRIVLANPAFRELLGVWGEIEGRDVLEVVRHAAINQLLSQIDPSTEPIVRDIELNDPSNRVLRTHAVGFPPKGPRDGTLAVFHDVTELRRVDRVRRDFIANASHELRTPLTAIQGFAETLTSSSLSQTEMKPHLAVILRHSLRMKNLLDDLMDLSRIESGRMTIERSAVDLCRVSRTLLHDLQPRIARANLKASLLPDTPRMAWADRRAVEHVLENLLTNAIRYTDEGGSISVDIEEKADLVEISVADTGIGIPEYARDRIFERFYRVDASRARAVGSTGLGLSIARHLVEAMGGTIRVESEMGVGSRFIFTLPRVRESNEPSRSSIKSSHRSSELPGT